jgi:tRNA(fMet)-specific endonuclease VapC
LYVLDTNAISNYYRGTYPELKARIHRTHPRLLKISAIAVMEILRGRIARVNESLEDAAAVGHACRELALTVARLAEFDIVPFDQPSATLYAGWSKKITRHGPNDCRIAASAIVNGLIVVTANRDSFQHIPGVRWEDWSR